MRSIALAQLFCLNWKATSFIKPNSKYKPAKPMSEIYSKRKIYTKGVIRRKDY